MMFNFVFDLLCFAAVLKATNPRSRLGAGAGSPMFTPTFRCIYFVKPSKIKSEFWLKYEFCLF